MHRLRRIGRRGGTAVVILFTAVWINMALQPCLMAAEPLLPGQHQDAGCPHCPQVQDAHCGDQAADACAYIDGFDFDGRSAQLADLQGDLLAVLAGTMEVPGAGPPAWIAPGRQPDSSMPTLSSAASRSSKSTPRLNKWL